MTTITVLNIKDIANTDYAFRGWCETTARLFNLNDYKTVYVKTVDTTVSEESDCISICDQLYYKSNLGDLEGYSGHSMSVSDVVIISSIFGARAFYCDTFGWHLVNSYCSGDEMGL